MTTLRMGIALVQVARNMKIAFPDGRVWSAQARVGLNIGPLSAGVVGLKRQLLSVVGDTINVAARMESLSLPSHVQATAAFHSALPPRFQSLFDKRVVHAKGKGDVDAFILDVPTKESALRELGLDICGDPVALKRILGQSA